MNPEFEDETPVNPFDLWEGANFKLKIRKVDGFSNYDKSEFASTSPLYEGDDKKLEDVWKQQHSLQGILASENFKSFQELEARFNTVIAHAGSDSDFMETIEENTDEPVAADAGEKTSEETLDYFRKLAEQ